jgi:hypothetical protein
MKPLTATTHLFALLAPTGLVPVARRMIAILSGGKCNLELLEKIKFQNGHCALRQ